METTRRPPEVAAAAASPLSLAVLHERIEDDALEIDASSKLFFLSLPEGCVPPKNSPEQRVFYCVCDGTKNDEFVYQHFFADFGPLHLGHVYAFCKRLEDLVNKGFGSSSRESEFIGAPRGSERVPSPAVYVCSSEHPHRRANAAVLVLAFSVGEGA